MTMTLRRAATAACALLLFALATPSTNASLDEAFSACDYEPVSFDAQGPRLGLPGGLAKVTPDSPLAINAATARSLDPCDAGVGGGGGGDYPQPDDCATFAAAQAQSFALGVQQSFPSTAAVGDGQNAIDGAAKAPTPEQLLAATRMVETSAAALCLGDPEDLTNELEDAKCISQQGPGGDGYSIVFCYIWCGLRPELAHYYVSTTGEDPASPTNEPLVYGAVGCAAGNNPVPPTGVSCGDNGHCWNEYREGIRALHGSCVHAAFGNAPTITARRCEYNSVR